MCLSISKAPLTLMIRTIFSRIIVYDVTDNNYYTKKHFNTSNITNNITRHSHNNYGLNVIKKVHTYIKHINNYDTDIIIIRNHLIRNHIVISIMTISILERLRTSH